MRLRLATYNVHDCVGLDGRYDPGRVAAVIKAMDADVVAIQEITLDHAGDLLAQLQADTGLKGIDGTLFNRGIGRYGNLLLTRLDVRDTRLHDLSVSRREPRGAIDTVLRTSVGPLRVVATHLGLRAAERRHQLSVLAQLITRGPAAAVLIGDLNQWASRTTPPVLRRCGMHGAAISSFPTRPAPLFALDRILLGPTLTAQASWRVDDELARVASDHFPMCTALTLTNGGAAVEAQRSMTE